MAYRGSLPSSVIVWLLNGAGLTLLFYLVYFFSIW